MEQEHMLQAYPTEVNSGELASRSTQEQQGEAESSGWKPGAGRDRAGEKEMFSGLILLRSCQTLGHFQGTGKPCGFVQNTHLNFKSLS